MTGRYVCRALPAIVMKLGWAAVGPANAQSLLPEDESGEMTVAGCLQRGGANGDKFVLASPTMGSAANLPSKPCTATVREGALELEHAQRNGIDDSMVGRFI